MGVIEVKELKMSYRVPVRAEGLRAAVHSLFRRRYRDIEAVKSISFELQAGEVVGFIGPNGAGKTTTLKILSGVLNPTGGEASVLGFVPWKREPKYLRRIAMVRGSRPLGVPPELTVLDALRFQKVIYDVSEKDFTRNLEELSDLLELGPLLERQARALSLGERTRAGLAWSLVYRPDVLFLDEPTIGLDIAAAMTLRKFVADYASVAGATIILTSHYMADVQALCRRIILIDRGDLMYDGAIAELAMTVEPYKLLRVTVGPDVKPNWSAFGEVLEESEGSAVLRVRREDVPAMTGKLLAELSVADLSVEEPPLERVMDQVYRKGITD